MNFLEKLYNQEYFAPILFGVIVVLAVAFVIVLILALRDLKKESASKNTTPDTNSLNENDALFAGQNVVSNDMQINQIPQQGNNMNVSPAQMQDLNMAFNQAAMPQQNMPYNQQVQPMPTQYAIPNQNVIPPQPQVFNQVMPNNMGAMPQSAPVEAEAQQAANDLDAIANTLLAEYKKENQEAQVQNETPQQDQFSSVYVTPNTLEQNSVSNMPNLADIPTPQPVRVVESSKIIDSSASQTNESNVDNIPNEEYHI